MAQVRRDRLAQLTDLPAGTGLEIGPLAAPLVLRSERDVRYVDVFDQPTLQEHYRDDPSVPCDDIPFIDYTLTTGSGVVTLVEAAKEEAPYAYVVACHVIEHVPDVATWLADIATLLTDDGLLVLVVPDKRHCFDFYRQQTSVGQMLQAAADRDRTPSIRAVYDHFREAVDVAAADTWKGLVPGTSSRTFTFEAALAHVERARAGHYVDSHVWTFTPDVFIDQVAELALLDLCDFTIDAFAPTPEGALEFYVVLRRIGPAVDATTRAALVECSRERARATLDGAPHPPNLLLAAEVERTRALEAQVAVLQAQVEAHQAQGETLRAQVDEGRAELARVKQSERWRVGGAVVGPLVRVRQQWGRRTNRRRQAAHDG